MTSIQKNLFAMQDTCYGDFQAKLMPGISRDDIIGVRIPLIRNTVAKQITPSEADRFLSQLPHRFYDENILHSILITRIKESEKCMIEVKRFLPYVDFPDCHYK